MALNGEGLCGLRIRSGIERRMVRCLCGDGGVLRAERDRRGIVRVR